MNTDAIKNFRAYVMRELQPATKELEKITSESSRKHLQKLVFTNVVNRFDSMIDHTLLDNSDHSNIVEDERISKQLGSPLTEAEFVRAVLSGSELRDFAKARIKEALRNSMIRERHSKKLNALFSYFSPDERVWNEPRVNPSTGEILSSFSIQIETTPHSVCGFADWLYSRRNALVHGSGSSDLLKNDIDQIKKLFKCKTTKTFKIQLSSIKTAANFYIALTELLNERDLSA